MAVSCFLLRRLFILSTLFLYILAEDHQRHAQEQQSASITSTVSDAASKLSGEAMKLGGAAWELGKDKMSALFSSDEKTHQSSTSPLGPETESCQTESANTEEASCPVDDYSEESDVDRDADLKGSQFELAETGEADGLLNQLYDIGVSSVSTVYRTAKKNIYDNGARLIKNFSEAVRSVISEELYTFLASTSTSLGDALFTPGATLYYLGEKAMTVSLILLSFLFSYLFFFRLSFLFILGMNAMLFLLHQLMGPKWIFDWLFYFGGLLSGLLWFMLAHYYVSAVVIVVAFIYSILFPLARRYTQRRPMEQMNDMERTILDISQRLGELERRQNNAFRESEQRQLEMLDILRRLDRNKNRPNN